MVKSERYYREYERLSRDPIVKAMAREVPSHIDLDSYEFMLGAMHEFTARGGKGQESIGGVAHAIKLLLKKKA